MWGIFFGEFQCLPVSDCPAASCDSGVLARGSESTSLYSAILVQSPCHNFLSCGNKVQRNLFPKLELLPKDVFSKRTGAHLFPLVHTLMVNQAHNCKYRPFIYKECKLLKGYIQLWIWFLNANLWTLVFINRNKSFAIHLQPPVMTCLRIGHLSWEQRLQGPLFLCWGSKWESGAVGGRYQGIFERRGEKAVSCNGICDLARTWSSQHRKWMVSAHIKPSTKSGGIFLGAESTFQNHGK